jgi:hypothetical protein
MYNYIFPGLNWNYWHPSAKSDTEGWNLLPYSLATHDDWLDSNDPTIAGRAEPSVRPL